MTGIDRTALAFPQSVRRAFGFLAEEGFAEVRSEPTFVRFERPGVFVNVFHGRRSYELGVEIGLRVDGEAREVAYDLATVLSASEAFAPSQRWSATTRDQVERFVTRLAELTEQHCLPPLRGDRAALARIEELSARRGREDAEAMRADDLRRRAKEAWTAGDRAAVVAAYDEIESTLTSVTLQPSERKRRDMARDRQPGTEVGAIDGSGRPRQRVEAPSPAGPRADGRRAGLGERTGPGCGPGAVGRRLSRPAGGLDQDRPSCRQARHLRRLRSTAR